MPYPSPYPPPPVTSSEPLTPSGWWYGVAGAVGAVGVILAIVVTVVTFSSYEDRIDDFQRVEVGGSGVVTLDETGGYTIYHEYAGADASDRFSPDIEVTVTAPDGTDVDLDPYDSDVTYFTSDVDGVALYSFRAFETGDYEVQSEAAFGEGADGDVAVGRGLGGGLVAGIVGAVVLGFGGAVAGGVIAIVTGIRRSRTRHMRQLSRVGQQPAWAGPPTRPPGPYGGGWGPTPHAPPTPPGPPAPPAPPPPPPAPPAPPSEQPRPDPPYPDPGQQPPSGQPTPSQPSPEPPPIEQPPERSPADQPTVDRPGWDL